MDRLFIVAVLVATFGASASASCQRSMVGAYRLQCETAAQARDDSAAIDACRSEAATLAACADDGEPVPGGAFLRAAALAGLAVAYAHTAQRARARAAYVESASLLETVAKSRSAGPSERKKARDGAVRARAAAAAL